MNKNIFIAIIVVLVIVVIVFWVSAPKTSAPVNEVSNVNSAPTDTTGAVVKDLNAVTIGNLDDEFKSIDADLKSL